MANGYACTLSDDTTDHRIFGRGAYVQIGGSTTKTLAVTVDPRSAARTYTATLGYELSAGVSGGGRLPGAIKPYLKDLGPTAGASITGSGALGFVYDRADKASAKKLLEEKWPPDGWNRLVIMLGGRVAGDARAELSTELGGSLSVEGETKAYLTLFPDGSFGVARSWSGRVDADGPGWLRDRLGVDHDRFPDDWSGRMAVEYEVLFGPGRTPLRLTTVADTQWGARVKRTTRVLNLTEPGSLAAVRRAMGVLANPFGAFSAAQAFFLNAHGNLWPALAHAETMASATYAVESKVRDFTLDIGPFGVGYRSERTNRTLVESRIRSGDRAQDFTCSGEPAFTAPEASEDDQPLAPEQVPAPSPTPPTSPAEEPSPTDSAAEPTPTPTAEPSTTPGDQPSGPIRPAPRMVTVPVPGPLDL